MESDNLFDLFDFFQVVILKLVLEIFLFFGNDMDFFFCDSGSLVISILCVFCLVIGYYLWVSKNGCYVLGLIEDYEVLFKQISQGQRFFVEMDI